MEPRMILNKEFDRDIIIYAFRYTLGRHSYAPGLMRGKLDEIWDQLSDSDKQLIFKEIEDYGRYLYLSRPNVISESAIMERADVHEWIDWRERKMRE
jgi:hypothetical protein